MPGRHEFMGRGAAALLAAFLLPAAATAQVTELPARVASVYEDAENRHNQGDYAGAVIQLRNVLQQEPNYLPAHLLLGQSYLQQGQGAAAESALKLAQRLGADPALTAPPLARSYLQQLKPEVLLAEIRPERFQGRTAAILWNLRGQAHLDLGQLTEADQAFQAAAPLDPGGIRHLVGQATVLLRSGDPRGAEHLARMALEKVPDDVEAWDVTGSAHHTLGEADQALAAYGRVIELQPNHVDARMARAGLYIDLGQPEKALADIRYVRDNHPLDLRAPYLQGVILFQENRQAEARAAFLDAAGVIDRMRPELFERRPIFGFIAGLVDYTLGRYEKAEEHLEPFLRAHPASAPARKILGSIALARNDPGTAVTELELALRSAPDDYRLLSLLGQAYLRMGHAERATALLEQANRLGAGDSDVRFNLAMSRYQAGEVEHAVDGLAAILEDDREHIQAGVVLTSVYIEQREFAKAVQVAGGLVARNPGDQALHNLLGSAEAGLGRTDAARVSFEKALALDPAYLPGRLNLAKLERRAGNLDRARQHLEEALGAHPENTEVMVELGRVDEAGGQMEDALRWLHKAAAAEKDGVKARLALVEGLLAMGRVEDAHLQAQEATRKAPDHLPAQLALAATYLAQDRPDLARVIYKRVVIDAGYDASLLYRMARLQLQAGARDDAVWSLEKAVKAQPKFDQARVALVDLLLQQGKLDLAEEHIVVGAGTMADPATVADLRGHLAMARQEPGQAVTHYRDALERQPTTGRLLQLHRALRVSGRAVEAIAALEGWLEGRPDDALVKAALAEGLLLDGDLARAQALYEEVLEAHPEAPGVLNNLAHVYLRRGDDRALELARRAHQLAPQDSHINDTLGWVLVRRGDAALGLKHLRNAFALSADNLEARYHIAYALEQLGRRDEAIAELEAALRADSRFNAIEGVGELRARLAAGVTSPAP